MWRDSLTPEEKKAVAQAQPGSLVHRLAALLDQCEGLADHGRIPDRGTLSHFDRNNSSIPRGISRLDE